MYGREFGEAVSLTMRYDTAEEADGFLNQYVGTLEEQGFLRVPPSDLGSNKNNGYTNLETGTGVAFDFFPGEDGGETYINFDFRSGIEFDAEDGEDGGALGVALDIVEEGNGVKRLSTIESKTGL